jgi:hypothetical protein
MGVDVWGIGKNIQYTNTIHIRKAVKHEEERERLMW